MVVSSNGHHTWIVPYLGSARNLSPYHKPPKAKNDHRQSVSEPCGYRKPLDIPSCLIHVLHPYFHRCYSQGTIVQLPFGTFLDWRFRHNAGGLLTSPDNRQDTENPWGWCPLAWFLPNPHNNSTFFPHTTAMGPSNADLDLPPKRSRPVQLISNRMRRARFWKRNGNEKARKWR